MRRPPGVNFFHEGNVHRTSKHRTAMLPFALVEGPPKRPGAGWGPTRSGAAYLRIGLEAQDEGRSHPDGAI
jgi:hypothetical protein